MSSSRLSHPEVELVLRRAAELENSKRASTPAADDGLTQEDLVRLGEEAGLSPESVARALAEWRRDALTSSEPPRAGLADVIGPSQLVVTREVPGGVDAIARSLERFMSGQLMVMRRHHGDRIEWEKARGLWPGLARSLDFARRYTFGPVSRVETLVVDEGAGRSSITFRIDLTDVRRSQWARVVGYTAAPALVLGTFGSAVGTPVEALGVAAGAGASFGAVLLWRERRRAAQLRETVQLGVERFLDLVVQRRLRAEARGARLDPDPE